jgi:hypothetical protein
MRFSRLKQRDPKNTPLNPVSGDKHLIQTIDKASPKLPPFVLPRKAIKPMTRTVKRDVAKDTASAARPLPTNSFGEQLFITAENLKLFLNNDFTLDYGGVCHRWRCKCPPLLLSENRTPDWPPLPSSKPALKSPPLLEPTQSHELGFDLEWAEAHPAATDVARPRRPLSQSHSNLTLMMPQNLA